RSIATVISRSSASSVCASSLLRRQGISRRAHPAHHASLGQIVRIQPVQFTRVERQIGSGNLSLETGKLAKQAHGAVVVRYGDTMTLTTAVEGEADEGRDFFPLVVDYREKTYAAGKFPGGFIKREGRPTTKEILTSRLIDRPIRPLFPPGYHNE